MKTHKVAIFGNLPQGTQVWLTPAQASARAHQITAVANSKPTSERTLYTADGQLGFKAGEEIAIEGPMDRGIETMLGLNPATAPSDDIARKPKASKAKASKPRAPTKAERAASSKAIADADAAVTAADADVKAAEVTLSAADDGTRATLEAELATARQKLSDAQAARTALGAAE